MSLKPMLTLRKPPAPANVEAFVQGAGESVVRLTSDAAPPSMAVPVAEAKALAPMIEVNSEAVEPAPQSSSQVAKHRGRGLLERASGRTTRRMTIYVSPELAKRIVRFSAETEREISDVAAEALEKYLDANV
jgi:hypothetical protein